MQEQMQVNIWLVGDGRVGRTSLIRKLMGILYADNQIIQTLARCINGISVRVNIMDPPTQLAESLAGNMFAPNDICVFVYDANRPTTFDRRFNDWHLQFCSRHNGNGKFYVIANDERPTMRRKATVQTSSTEQQVIDETVQIFQTNSLIGDCVQTIFDNIIRNSVEDQINAMFEDFDTY